MGRGETQSDHSTKRTLRGLRIRSRDQTDRFRPARQTLGDGSRANDTSGCDREGQRLARGRTRVLRHGWRGERCNPQSIRTQSRSPSRASLTKTKRCLGSGKNRAKTDCSLRPSSTRTPRNQSTAGAVSRSLRHANASAWLREHAHRCTQRRHPAVR